MYLMTSLDFYLHLTSIILALASAMLALYLIPLVGKVRVSLLFAAALVLLAIDRTFAVFVHGEEMLLDPSLYIIISGLLGVGVIGCLCGSAYFMRGIFIERKQAEEKIRKLNEELESKVQERTRKLVEAQEELVRKEKLAVLGQVAGSVGHELRNPLGVMSNAVYFLQTVLVDADDRVKEYLGMIEEEIAGSERIVSELLDSVRAKPPRPEAVEVRTVVARALHKLTIPASVKVKLELPDDLPALRVDAMQINQVFRNLIINAVEAMPGGGELQISAVATQPEGTVTVSVRDTGVGMTEKQLDQLFEPLLTTKARGTGLGLMVVKNLTGANGGSVGVESAPGQGSTFTVVLPSAGDAPALGSLAGGEGRQP
jgi:signal transduction histidine kinase